MVDRLAAIISYQIYKKQLYNHIQIRQIQYGLQSVMSETIKIFSMCLVLYFTGYLKYGLFAMIVFSSIRVWAGGYHAETYLKCFLVSMSIIYGAVFGGLYIQNCILYIIEGIVSFIIIYKFAPADHKNQPIVNEDRRKRVHRIAIGITFFWFCILLMISGSWKYIGMNSILFETVIIVYMVFVKKGQLSTHVQK